MRSLLFLPALVALAGCKKDAEPPPRPAAPALRPQEVSVEGAYHAVACGPVTAVWSGSADALKDLPQPAPKPFGVESLAFRFADGTSKGFAPTGQVFFNDWTFGIFAPDCSAVALQVDHYGPVHVVKLDQLRGYLEGRVKPVQVQALHEKDALVHSDLLWRDAASLEFVASCCGGAQAFRASVKDGALERLLDAPSAPKGLKRVNGKYEVVP
ncbi:MAG: hypothetical protein ACOZQL_24040 [Myxococcota bacterium]